MRSPAELCVRGRREVRGTFSKVFLASLGKAVLGQAAQGLEQGRKQATLNFSRPCCAILSVHTSDVWRNAQSCAKSIDHLAAGNVLAQKDISCLRQAMADESF